MGKEIEARTLSREEAADQLDRIAEQLRAGGHLDVAVGNKTVHLSPPAEVGMELTVREKSSLLRGSPESLGLTLEWKPE